MEYASGGELFDLIIRNQRLSERDAAEFLLQILSGVQYMHNNNVMHR
jgi:serine/threonine protein kinase